MMNDMMKMPIDMMKGASAKAGIGKKAKPGRKAAGSSKSKAADEARKKKRSVVDPGKVIGIAQTAQPVKVMKHGGVVRASDKAKTNRAWSNRG